MQKSFASELREEWSESADECIGLNCVQCEHSLTHGQRIATVTP